MRFFSGWRTFLSDSSMFLFREPIELTMGRIGVLSLWVFTCTDSAQNQPNNTAQNTDNTITQTLTTHTVIYMHGKSEILHNITKKHFRSIRVTYKSNNTLRSQLTHVKPKSDLSIKTSFIERTHHVHHTIHPKSPPASCTQIRKQKLSLYSSLGRKR
jgi:hypothetical protein